MGAVLLAQLRSLLMDRAWLYLLAALLLFALVVTIGWIVRAWHDFRNDDDEDR